MSLGTGIRELAKRLYCPFPEEFFGESKKDDTSGYFFLVGISVLTFIQCFYTVGCRQE